jgi:hypothetical protein
MKYQSDSFVFHDFAINIYSQFLSYMQYITNFLYSRVPFTSLTSHIIWRGFFVFRELWLEVIVRFGGIDFHHCLNFLFITLHNLSRAAFVLMNYEIDLFSESWYYLVFVNHITICLENQKICQKWKQTQHRCR